MHKENGRLSPRKKTEKASSDERTVVCKKCKAVNIIGNIEFGEIIYCTVCGHALDI